MIYILNNKELANEMEYRIIDTCISCMNYRYSPSHCEKIGYKVADTGYCKHHAPWFGDNQNSDK
jgi:hypothetical protein